MIPLSVIVVELCLSPKSKTAYKAIKKAVSMAESSEFTMPTYLKYNAFGVKNSDKYDYENEKIWHLIQYLPDEIKDVKFYNPNKKGMEKRLYENYLATKKFKRTKLAKIKKT